MAMPRPTDEAREAFRALVPADPSVTLRPMFGNLAAFVNGNMFAGLFGDDLFVRVREADHAALLAKGGKDFEPMPGRAMTGYAVLPAGWRKPSSDAARWVGLALAGTSTMPAKVAKARVAKAKPRKA
jgi:TfoX/Sxy family transcriptional regulator of competence genes